MRDKRLPGRWRAGGFLPLILGIACVASGVAVVQVKHHSRAVTAQLTHQHHTQEQLHWQWAQLRLEEATLGGHGRVQRLAQSQFDMVEPKDYVIVRRHPAQPSAGTVAPW